MFSRPRHVDKCRVVRKGECTDLAYTNDATVSFLESARILLGIAFCTTRSNGPSKGIVGIVIPGTTDLFRASWTEEQTED